MSQDECTDISDEVSRKAMDRAVKELNALEKNNPERADEIDQAIPDIKDGSLNKICLCSSDGCNGPQGS
jgi:hypothetical protein